MRADQRVVASEASTIVPANRFGQLLVEARHRQGADLEALSLRSDFTVGELADLEAGHRLLDDELINQITALYEIDCGPIIPQRAELTIDLDENLLSASGKALRLESSTRDHILDRYLSLVYLLRDRPAGTTVPLRGEDIAILAASLAERAELVEEQLLLAMAPEREQISGTIGWLKRRLWVPGAGALVGAVSIGTLVMVSGEPTPPERTDEPEPDPRSRDELRASAAEFSASIGLSQPAPTPQERVVTVPATSDAPDAATSIPQRSGTENTSTATIDTSSTSVTADDLLEPTDQATPVPTDAPTADETTTTQDAPTADNAAEGDTAPEILASSDALRTPEALGAEAEALLPFVWQELLPNWNIEFKESNSQFRGLTYPYDRTIEMFVRDDDTAESLAGILAHEIAHAFDVEYLDDGDRNDWLEIRGIQGNPWWPDAYARDFQTGAGDFAESFAFWAIGDASSSELAGAPDAAELALIEEFLIRR